MPNKVRSVRVPPEIETLDLTKLVRECARHLRDLESAALLSSQGDTAAAGALLRTRQAELGRRIGTLVLDAAKRARHKT